MAGEAGERSTTVHPVRVKPKLAVIWLALASALAAGIVTMASRSHLDFKARVTERFNSQQSLTARSLRNLVNDQILETRQNLRYIADQYLQDTGSLRSLVESTFRVHGDDLLGISVLDENLRVVLSSPEGSQWSGDFASYLTEGGSVEGGGTGAFLTERALDEGGRSIIHLFVPARGRSGKTEVHIVGHLSVERFMKEHLLSQEGGGMCFILTEESGNLLALLNRDHEVLRDMQRGNVFSLGKDCLNCHKADGFADFREALFENRTVHTIYRYPNGATTNRTSVPLSILNRKWTVSVCSPFEDIQTLIDRNLRENLILALITLGAFFGVGAALYVSEKKKALLEAERAYLDEIVKASEALKESEEKYRKLFEESSDSIFLTTPEGEIVEANRAGIELLGCENEEGLRAVSLSQDFYVDPGDRSRFQTIMAEEGSVENFETRLKRIDGGVVTILISGRTVSDSQGKIVLYRLTVRDITEQKRMREQLTQAQKLESLGNLAGGIAHDFNNILGVIMAYSELAMHQLPEKSEPRENLKEVLAATYRASSIVKEILAFSRKSKQARKPVQVHDVAEEALRFLRRSLPATIDIRKEIDPGSGCVMGDSTQLHQVIMNLCANARDAMRKSGGALTVKLESIFLDLQNEGKTLNLSAGNYLLLTVTDTGHGMDDETKDRIFDPYFTTKSKGEGSGLGLAMVHGIVEGYGGAIAVESSPGKGTTFRIYLPTVEKENVEHEPERRAVPRGIERILFVDDEPALARSGQKTLQRLGYAVTTTTNSLEALKMVRAGPGEFDLVITDQTMAGLTGVRLTEKIRSLRRDLPIIICTGYSDVLNEEKAKALGVKALLLKPLDRDKLARAVRKALDG